METTLNNVRAVRIRPVPSGADGSRAAQASDLIPLRIRLLLVGLVVVLTLVGCTRARTRYRVQADKEVATLVQEKVVDPRWAVPCGFNLNIDERSRYYDPNDPDRTPLPPDDPYSHAYMHNVAGKKGYKLWHRWGDQAFLENPDWRDLLGQYMPVTEEGKIKLDLEGAVQLAYIHSPDYRSQLETLYLSALDVSTERFRFVTQFYGGVGTTFRATGNVASGSGASQSTLTTGTGAAQVSNFGIASVNTGSDPAQLQFQRNLATGGQLIVGFANSFVWQFAGGETNNTTSLINFNLIQPLLRAGGRAVSLEQLTIVERNLLANLRAIQRYRQGFYTNIACGYFAVTGPQRQGGFSGGTGLTGFSGQGAGGLGGVGQATNFGRAGFGAATAGGGGAAGGAGFAGGAVGQVGGFVGLLQQLQQIRNTEETIKLDLRTLKLLEANLEAGLIDITQVDIFRQNLESERANLLNAQINFENTLDTFKRQILGMPPSLPVELDDSLIEQFRFIDPKTREVEIEFSDFIEELSSGGEEPSIERLQQACDDLQKTRADVQERLDSVDEDLRKLELAVPAREKTMPAEDRPVFEQDKKRLYEVLAELKSRYASTADLIDKIRQQLKTQPVHKSYEELVGVAGGLRTLMAELTLVQVRARLESVTVEPVELDSVRALEIARQNRLDWMNNRATLVNTWRLITFNANALRSNVSVTFAGSEGTIKNNMVSFDPSNGFLQAGIRFDPPVTRLLERNNYRQALISYQQDRRTLIQYEDAVNQILRQDVRQMRQFQIALEYQRKAVAIAIRRVDKTLEDLSEPPAPVQPGQPAPQLSPTAALNLLTAISDLRNAQNNFLGVWVNYYSERMELIQDLGIMQLDERGLWIDRPLNDIIGELEPVEVEPLPPPVPDEWLRDAGLDPKRPLDEQTEELPATPPVLKPNETKQPGEPERLPAPKETNKASTDGQAAEKPKLLFGLFRVAMPWDDDPAPAKSQVGRNHSAKSSVQAASASAPAEASSASEGNSALFAPPALLADLEEGASHRRLERLQTTVEPKGRGVVRPARRAAR